MTIKVEIRVRPVVRYTVTRYYEETLVEDGQKITGSSSHSVGEYDNVIDANRVAEGLAKCEADGVDVQCFPGLRARPIHEMTAEDKKRLKRRAAEIGLG